jgi:hypothetical protein
MDAFKNWLTGNCPKKLAEAKKEIDALYQIINSYHSRHEPRRQLHTHHSRHEPRRQRHTINRKINSLDIKPVSKIQIYDEIPENNVPFDFHNPQISFGKSITLLTAPVADALVGKSVHALHGIDFQEAVTKTEKLKCIVKTKFIGWSSPSTMEVETTDRYGKDKFELYGVKDAKGQIRMVSGTGADECFVFV